MSPLDCRDCEEHLDLYAAGACDPATAAAVERHLATCPQCAEIERASRQVQGLLDLHWQAPDALQRLHAKIDKEDRRLRQPRRVLPFVSRLTAAAALVLLSFGLLGTGSQTSGVIPAALVADSGSRFDMKAVPAAVREAHLPARPAENETLTAWLDRRGKSDDAYTAFLRQAERDGALPQPPLVELTLKLGNPGLEERTLHLEDDRATLALDLRGPGVLRAKAMDRMTPLAPKPVTLAPGETYSLPIHRLIEGQRGDVHYLYWTEPGEYTLTVQLRVPVSHGPQANLANRDRDWALYASPPIHIQVVEMR